MIRWLGIVWGLLVAGVISARAQTRPFLIGAETIQLERADTRANAYFRAFRPNRATGRWEVDVVVTNGSPQTLRSPLVLRFDVARQISPGIPGSRVDGDGLPFLNLTPLLLDGELSPGETLRTFTLSLGDGQTRPELVPALYSRTETSTNPPLALVRTLAADGLPVAGVTATEIGPDAPQNLVSARGGWLTLTARPGVRGWRFQRDGFGPVIRLAAGLQPGVINELPSVQNGPAPAGDVSSVPGDALPIPSGWSPALLRHGRAGAAAIPASPLGRQSVLAEWDDAALAWRAVRVISAENADNIALEFPRERTLALLVPDTVPIAPALPAVGELLPEAFASLETSNLRATGRLSPATSPASRNATQVTSVATVEFTSTAGPLSSGLQFSGQFTEEYRLRDGTRRLLPSYSRRLVARRPVDAAANGPLVAEFSVRPFQLLPGEELAEAIIRVEVLAPEAFAGGVLTGAGGSLSDGTLTVSAPAGAFARSEAALLREFVPAPETVPAGLVLERAFELNAAQAAPGSFLKLQTPAVSPNRDFVLARAVFDEGRHGFQPVQRFRSDATGQLTSVEPVLGDRLQGMDGGGQYWLFQTAAPEALVAGAGRDSAGNPAAGLLARRGPWSAFTDAAGRFQLLAPAGRSEVSLLDSATGDTGLAEVEVAGALAAVQAAVDAAPRGPRVVTVSPANVATGVPRVTPVVVTFNRPLNPVTVVAGGVRLLGAADVPVSASVSLNLAGTAVTLLPTSPLAPAAVHRVQIALTVADLTARPVEGAREFQFTTVDDSVARGIAAQVTIYAPGSTNLTAEVLNRIPAYDPARDFDGIVIEGSPGTAEPGRPVILVNESTGETQTVLADVDGSFVSFVRGSVDDFISAVLVNANGTRNQLPATRQRFDDGTVGLFASGGTIRSTGPGVPVDLIVDPGSVSGKTLFKLESLTTNTFHELIAGKLPAGAGPILGAFELTESGDPLGSAADISVPVKLADLGLPPGSEPTNFAFVVVMPLRVDGRTVHQIVDKATYEATGPEGGRVRTASPPFVGMLARKLSALAASAGASAVTTPKVASNNENPHKGETAVFGIMPLFARGPLEVGGFVRAITRNEDGTETSRNLPGAAVRIVQAADVENPDASPLAFDGDLVSISDERGNFGFLFRPSEATETRALMATHPRFPFQRPHTGTFAGERQGITVVNAELHFLELPSSLSAVEGTAPPRVTVGHEPALPAAGSGDGATIFVTAVDDKLVGPPSLRIEYAEDQRGNLLAESAVTLTPVAGEADQPGRKVRQFRVNLNQAGRVVLIAAAADDLGQTDTAQHAVSFGVTRPVLPPGDAADLSSLRVTFAWPPANATNLPALLPITVRFNRALPAELLQPGQFDWLTFDAAHSLRRVTASGDRREVTVFYDGRPTGPVSLTVGPGIRGESGKDFDQDSESAGAQPFTLEFAQTEGITADFEGQSGAGVLQLGRFAYALERRSVEGTLKVLDFADPREPEVISTIKVGYPTAFALIPGYSLPMTPEGGCVTEDLLALFTGHANEPKYLQLGRIENGRVTLGRRLILSGGGTDGDGQPSVAEGVTDTESLSQIVKAKWSPPYLGYLELGADVTSIRLLNLTAFQRAVARKGVLDPAAPLNGTDGTDANGDGDFCDEGDQFPVPGRDPLHPPGMAFSTAPVTRAERIDDFDFDAGLGLMVGISRFVGTNQPPRFATLLAATDTNRLDAAFLNFGATESLRRVLLLPGLTLETLTNRVVRDVALVSIGTGGDGALAIVDVTVPSAPQLLNRFSVPPGEGTPAGLQRRADGLIAVATSRSTLLLEPSQLARPATGVTHPSIVSRVEGTGTGVRDFVADASGVNLTHGGGTRRYVETAPQFSFVHFNAPINPKDLAAQPPATVAGFLRSATPVRVAEVMPAGTGTNVPALDPERHYYVLVEAPGGAADSEGLLPLVLSAVDASGLPQPDRGGTVVPAVVGDEQLYSALIGRRFLDVALTVINLRRGAGAAANAVGTLAKIKTALAVASNAQKLVGRLSVLATKLRLLPDQFVARRLTDDPDHPLYNRFLAGPFVLLGGAPDAEQLTALRDQAAARELDRVYLRPSPRLWVGLPSERQRSALQIVRPFSPPASKLPGFVSQLRLNPSVTIAGIQIPFAGDAIEQAANLTISNPGNPIGNFFDQGETVTLLVSLLNNVPVVSAIVKGDWQPLLLPGAHGLLRVNYTERPMILVPGFAGSKLEVNGKNAWISLALTDEGRELKSLRLNPDGTPVAPSFATDAVRYSVETPLVDLEPIYGTWLEHLTGELGMTEYDFRRPGLLGGPSGAQVEARLRLDGQPQLDQSPTPNLFVFPYDWRLDSQRSAEKLREYVRLALELNPDADGVDLVGHSNGGLVARAYMLLPGQRPLVKRLITVGTPWLGAPKPLAGLRTGDMNEPGINIVAPIPAVRKMLQFAPGAHQLLPSREYFDLGFRPLVEDGVDVNTNGVANEAFTFEGFMDTLAKHFLRKPVEELGFTLESLPGGEHPVRAKANGFREGRPVGIGIGDHREDASDVEMHHIVGMGAVPDTVGQIRVRGRLVPQPATTNVTLSVARVSSRETDQVRDGTDVLITPEDGVLAVNPTNQFRMSEEIEVRYVSGDGTVPIASLARGYRGGDGTDLNARGARVYPLIGAFQDELTGHNPMLTTDTFLNLFDAVYGGRPVEQVTVTVGEASFTEGSLGSLSVNGSVPSGGDKPISFVVDFGDGGVELRHGLGGVTVQHRYRQSGTYLVTVGAATDDGIYGLASRKVVVANVPPAVTIKGVAAGEEVGLGDTRVLFAEVSDPGLDDRHTFAWKLPGGQARGVSQFASPVTFDEPGTQTVTVEVSDGEEVGTATLTVNVRGLAAGEPVPGFGADSALLAGRARRAALPGFVGGHPELIVRVHGHAPGAFETTGVSVKQEGLGSAIEAVLRGGVMVALFSPRGALGVELSLDRLRLPLVARFLGQLAQDSEYVRLLRELPNETAGIDFAATSALVGVQGKDGPLEVDLLYLEGGIPNVLRRWRVPQVATGEGVRLTVDWRRGEGGELEAVLERVTPSLLTGGTLDGNPLGTLLPVFSVAGEQAAGDRLGPATVGLLNPATDQVTLLARDNLTADTNVVLYAVFDADENGRLDDDTFYPLDTNVVTFARLPKRPFAVVGVDEQGNVGSLDPFRVTETRNFLGQKAAGQSTTDYEQKLTAIRETVRAVITEARDSGVIKDRFLLKPEHLWVFEQGSGANLWKADFVRRCNGIYLPGKSDNDYELFLPVHLGAPYGFSEAERQRFEADGPHDDATLTGDWYFRRPTGLDAAGSPTADDGAIVTWEYAYPVGQEPGSEFTLRVSRQATDDDLAAGFHSPLTPAEVIAREFTRTVTGTPARRKLLPDTSFFPERQEHFKFGHLHLQRPPEFGDDPIGDGGTGRQMLMLKWLLEGAFVTASDEGGAGDFSPGAPTLAQIFANWQQVGVPRAEGLEWGLFQDFAALKAKPFQTAEIRFGPNAAAQRLRILQRSVDDAVAQQQASRLKKLGKAAIRATLARLAGDANLNALVAGVPASRVTDNPVRSFEHFILETARSSEAARAAFGDFAKDRDDLTEPPDLGDFLRAKNGDRDYLGLIVSEPGLYERFVTTTFTFLRNVVQRPTQSPYRDFVRALPGRNGTPELRQRLDNLRLVLNGDGPGRPGLLALNTDRRLSAIEVPLAAEAYSPGAPDEGSVRGSSREGSNGDEPSATPARIARSATPAETLAEISLQADQDVTLRDGAPVPDPSLRTAVDDDDSSFELDVEVVDSLSDEDDTTVVRQDRLPGEVPAPVEMPPLNLIEGLFLDASGSAAREVRTHAEDMGRNQLPSPGRLLRTTDRLFLRFRSEPGLSAGTLQLSVTPLGGEPLLFPLNERPGEPGIYVTTGMDPARFAIVEEEEFTFDVLKEGSVVATAGFTLDVLDVAGAGIDRFYDLSDRDIVAALGTQAGARIAGDVNFPNDLVARGRLAEWLAFVRNAGSQTPGIGKADLLILSSHGSGNGSLSDDQGRTLFVPNSTTGEGFVSSSDWNLDVDWVLLASCNQLTPDTAGTGAINWKRAFTSPVKPIHGLLGAFKPVPADLRGVYTDVFGDIVEGVAVLTAYRKGMEQAGLSWAALYQRRNENETFNALEADAVELRPGDLLYNRGGLNAPEVCGRADVGIAPVPADGSADGLRVWPSLSVRVEPLVTSNTPAFRQHRVASVRSDLVHWKRPAKAEREAGSAEQVTELAAQFLARELPDIPSLRLEQVAPEMIGEVGADGGIAERTNRWTVAYQASVAGVPLWRSRVLLRTDADGVDQLAGKAHFVALPSGPGELALSLADVLPAVRDLAAQQGWTDFSVGGSQLLYADPATLAKPASQSPSKLTVEPLWRITLDLRPAAGGIARDYRFVWIHALTGKPVSVTTY